MSKPERGRWSFEARQLEGDELIAFFRTLAVDRLDVPVREVPEPEQSRRSSRLTPEQAREILGLIDGGAPPEDLLRWLDQLLRSAPG